MSLENIITGFQDQFETPITSMSITTSITNHVNLSATIGGPTELSPEGLAQAVWNYLKANPTTTGSMKEVLEKVKSNADLIPALL